VSDSTNPLVDPPDAGPRDSEAPDGSASLERLRDAYRRATGWLTGAGVTPPAVELRALADEVEARSELQVWDRYGEDGLVAEVERTVADLLGKPSAAMFPSGIMAQQSVLRVWADRSGSSRVALPDLSHLLRDELDGPRLLHGFRFEHLSTGHTLPTAAALTALPGHLAAVVLELPLRYAGYLLPSWDELIELTARSRERGIPVHFDGARLWESAPYLGHTLPEIAHLADSVYVSLYKGLGGLAGAVVVGADDVVAEARQWRQRMGGTLVTMLPYAAAGLRGLRDELPRMAEFHQYAVALAEALPAAGISVSPAPPHTNAFRLLAPVDATVLLDRLVGYTERAKTVLTPPWQPADVPGWSWTEFTVGSATVRRPIEDIVDLLARVLIAGESA
jgi:threonine aldolase